MTLKAEEFSSAHWAVVYITMWQNGKAWPELFYLDFEDWVSEFPSLAYWEGQTCASGG